MEINEFLRRHLGCGGEYRTALEDGEGGPTLRWRCAGCGEAACFSSVVELVELLKLELATRNIVLEFDVSYRAPEQGTAN